MSAYSVTGFKARVPEIVVFDTEPEAREKAGIWLKQGYNDVVVWKQVATPRLETTVAWEEPND